MAKNQIIQLEEVTQVIGSARADEKAINLRDEGARVPNLKGGKRWLRERVFRWTRHSR